MFTHAFMALAIAGAPGASMHPRRSYTLFDDLTARPRG